MTRAEIAQLSAFVVCSCPLMSAAAGMGKRAMSTAAAVGAGRGPRLERAFAALGANPEGRRLLDAYGKCVDAKLDDVKKGCCEEEYKALFAFLEGVVLKPKREA